MAPQALAMPVQESGGQQVFQGMVAPMLIQSVGTEKYRMFPSSPRASIYSEAEPSNSEQTASIGTVMVSGGKTFYRSWSRAWSEQKLLCPTSQSSRRVSDARTENEDAFRWGHCEGEDEEGRVVNFVDLTAQMPSMASSSDLRSRRSSASAIDSRRNSFLAADMMYTRRDSYAGSVASTRRGSLVGDRRPSIGGIGDRRPSRGGLGRRGSVGCLGVADVEQPERRGSLGGSGMERRSSWQRRGSLGLERHEGLGLGLGLQRRGSCEPVDDLGSFQRARRGSLATDRRNSGLNLMPTVFDSEEGQEADAETCDGKKAHPAIVEGNEDTDDNTDTDENNDGENQRSTGSNDDSAHAREDNGTNHSVAERCGSDFSKDQDCTAPAIQVTAPADDSKAQAPHAVISLAKLPYTRDIDVSSILSTMGGQPAPGRMSVDAEQTEIDCTLRRRTTMGTSLNDTTVGTFKVAEAKVSRIWRRLALNESLSTVQRGAGTKYPNTPLSLVLFEQDGESSLFVGLLAVPTLLKIIPPKHHEPDKGGRFNVLPIDHQRFLLADESSHQIFVVNYVHKIRSKLIAGCGKRGYLDGPLEICRMHSPCALALDPRSHYIYVADKGNHVIRKIDLASGKMSTIAGSGVRGNRDSQFRAHQALDSPFEVSFAEPHFLLISCADNSVRNLNLRTGYLETLLVGS